MATKKTDSLANFTVFGTRPKDSIFQPQIPFNLRNDCKAGFWKIGEEDFIGREIEISIIKVAQFFGTLGQTADNFWMQVWFVAAPTCTILPQNTVCVTYLKKRSISQFSQKVTQLMENGEPALGLFKGFFQKHNGDKGDYYSVIWDWRERNETETEQLQQIADFMATKPKLLDMAVNLIPIDGLPQEELDLLISSAKSNRAMLPASA